MSAGGAPVEVASSRQGDPGRRWKSLVAVATKLGAAVILPLPLATAALLTSEYVAEQFMKSSPLFQTMQFVIVPPADQYDTPPPAPDAVLPTTVSLVSVLVLETTITPPP